MTKQEIIDNAPDGATHTIESFGSIDYLKWENHRWYLYYSYSDGSDEWKYTNYKIIGEFKHTIKPL